MQTEHGLTIAIHNWDQATQLPSAIVAGLESARLLSQFGVPAEVLVIDNHSQDGSVSLLRNLESRYYHSGLRVRSLPSRIPPGNARGQALRHASYRYIAFTCADNQLLPDNLPTFLNAIKQTHANGVYGSTLIRSATGQDAFNAHYTSPIQDSPFDQKFIDLMAIFDRNQLIDELGSTEECWDDKEAWYHLVVLARELLFVPLVIGYRNLLPRTGNLPTEESENVEEFNARVNQIAAQIRERRDLPLKSRHRRFHPELGYF